MNNCKKADEYIKTNHIAKEELPVFHVAPPVGWMNDPNGFSMYQGKAHLFYQYHPYSKEWGPMHWGHCISEDFVKWEELPVALAPEEEYDKFGCFSGSGIETEEGHVLVYTGVMKEEKNGVENEYQNQCIAIGDGIVYKKSEQNPVVTGNMLPTDFSREHFRDPKIWKESDGYYMVVGNKTTDGRPQIVLFHSADLKKWNYVSVLADDCSGRYGTMWECPDFFSLEGEAVLIASPQDMCADEEFHNGNNAVYFTGKYDRVQHRFAYDAVYALDDGLDFYAPQTMCTEDGRRIMIAWMQSWDSNIRLQQQKWSCMMTLPRELKLINGRLRQSPIREIENYHTDSVFYKDIKIEGECHFPDIKGRILDMTVEIAGDDYRTFTIQFAQNERFHTSLTYDRERNVLELDRTYSGMVRDTTAFRRVRRKYPKETMKFRMILDRYSAEIFADDGEQVLSTTFYTTLEAEDICFICDGMAVTTIQKYAISVE